MMMLMMLLLLVVVLLLMLLLLLLLLLVSFLLSGERRERGAARVRTAPSSYREGDQNSHRRRALALALCLEARGAAAIIDGVKGADEALRCLRWLGVLGGAADGAAPLAVGRGDAPAPSVRDAFCALLEQRLAYGPGERDMAVMQVRTSGRATAPLAAVARDAERRGGRRPDGIFAVVVACDPIVAVSRDAIVVVELVVVELSAPAGVGGV